MIKLFIFVSLGGISMLNGSLLLKNHYKLLEGNRNSAPLISPTVFESTFNQTLDHFNEADKRTWKQYYLFKDSHYQLGGPVYLWIWDIGEADDDWLEEEYWHSHAKKNGAFLFLLEHRFYGKSQPLHDTATSNLRFLNASQALADVATFIEGMNEIWEFPEETKWIVFGAFYGGSLAAWMRLKYPNLVHGAVASSAPVQAKADFHEYLNSVGDTLASYKKECQKDIGLANQKLDSLVDTENGRKKLGDIFRLCTPLKYDKLDISYFISNMADYISINVQYDRWGKNVKYVCDKMLENSNTKEPIDRYADLMHMFVDKNGESCLPTNFSEYVGLVKRSDVMSAIETNRVWIYQVCSQFGWFQTTGKKSKTFSKHINMNFFVNLCSKVFNPAFNQKYITKEAGKTNSLFKGLNIDVPRIIFVHGTADPIKSVGITTTKKKKHIDVVIVQGGSHCSELGEATSNHPSAKKDAQKKIMRIIDSWL